MPGSPEAGLPLRNLGILAHVDAGKTTLTEQLLYLSGSIAAAGSVDRGTSVSDRMEVERRRGISVRASTLSFAWQGVQVNLIDTPGHTDFSAEVERSLRVLDAAMLVVCAAEGIQAQTETVWQALRTLGLPTLVFLNKIDRVGADVDRVFAALRRELSPAMVRLNRAIGQGRTEALVEALSDAAQAELVEALASGDDLLLQQYLESDRVEPAAVQAALKRAVRDGRLFPVLCGSAKTGAGVRALLDAVAELLPDAGGDPRRPVSGVVYRLDHDPRLGRVAGVRLYAGTLRNRDRVLNHTAGREELITQVKRLALDRYEDTGLLRAGEIGCLCGMPEARIGDVLGDPEPVPGGYALSEPLLSVQVKPDRPQDLAALVEAVHLLSSEDPHLDCRWHPDERELHLRIMGTVQTEILAEVLRVRFGLEAAFGSPTVIYRETPARVGYGEESYTMPKPCWAILRFRLEPGERGSGVRYLSTVDKSAIHPKYQNEIETNLPESLRQGIKGWEVTDLRLTLVDGSHHLLHSRPGDFKLAANMAILKGLVETGTVLLEPMLAFRIAAPLESLGRVSADVTHRRGTCDPAEIAGDQFVLHGRFPLATSMDYAVRLSSLTRGRGTLTARFAGYRECPDELGAVRPRRGVSPLDRARYILWWRGALTDSLAG